jgi:hypothetical protein
MPFTLCIFLSFSMLYRFSALPNISNIENTANAARHNITMDRIDFINNIDIKPPLLKAYAIYSLSVK